MSTIFNYSQFLLVGLLILSTCGNTTVRDAPSKKDQNPPTAAMDYPNTPIATAAIKTGAENYTTYLPLLAGKRIGIVTNQTGIITEGTTQVSIVDFLLSKKINLQKIFAPEHGFRGTADAGEHIKDGTDTKTGLPVISLYGNNKKPKAAQLAGIDVLVFDLQDVGARFYTYISSLHYIMEACAENDIPLIILDRPNPNGGIIDGPILEKENSSFVGMHPIPILHGMTIGEYGQMINGEKWLKNNVTCKITIIPCLNYKRDMRYDVPVKPSPNLPNSQSINLYPSLCLFEGTTVSSGRGTDKQFQIYGSPYLPKKGFSFTPKPNEGAKDPMYNGTVCYGEDLSNAPRVTKLELKWLIRAYQETEDKTKFFIPFFTKLAGTQQLKTQIEKNVPEQDIRKSWESGLEAFKKMREPYLLY